jgi:hypothetical protein
VKKNVGQLSLTETFRTLYPKKLSLSSQKYGFGVRDPGSGKNLFRIPDPEVKKAPDPGSGSATLCDRFKKNFLTKMDEPRPKKGTAIG